MRGADKDRCLPDVIFRRGPDHRSPEVDVRCREAAAGGGSLGSFNDRRPPGRLFFLMDSATEKAKSGRLSAYSESQAAAGPERLVFNRA